MEYAERSLEWRSSWLMVLRQSECTPNAVLRDLVTGVSATFERLAL